MPLAFPLDSPRPAAGPRRAAAAPPRGASPEDLGPHPAAETWNVKGKKTITRGEMM